jgi:hypothetical protein
MVAHQSGHQRGAERASLAARIVERQGGQVELPVDDRFPLIVGLEQRCAGIDLDL